MVEYQNSIIYFNKLNNSCFKLLFNAILLSGVVDKIQLTNLLLEVRIEIDW